MSRPIEDYALVGDLQSAALVSRDGSIDWLCLPRFDSEACFAALLGDERYGYWQIAPARDFTRIRRRYRPGTLVLETEFTTASGVVRLVDCMPPRAGDPVLIRLVEGVAGRVDMRMTLAARFEYGLTLPRVRQQDAARRIVAGGQSLWVFSPLEVRTADTDLVARFTVGEGDRVPVAAVWRPSHLPAPSPPPASALVEQADAWWRQWVAGLRHVDQGAGEWQDAVLRSLITLKALTYAPTGGLLAAPTTSLPQQPCGMRNWDYRYCWIRDAADAVDAFLAAGADHEAASLLNWLGRTVGGPVAQAQPVYRITGERRMPEIEAHWLPGYENAQPVRIGNAAADLDQLGTFGDVLRARLAVRSAGAQPEEADPDESEAILSFLESRWQEPDAGIWEMRGPPRQFVHTKAMIWVAADAAITTIESFGDRGPVRRWRRLAQGRPCRRARTRLRPGPATCSRSTTARPPWTPACSVSRCSDSSRPPIPGSPGQWRPSAGNWTTAACCCATRLAPRPTGTASRPARRDTCPARSGWRRPSRQRARRNRRGRSTRPCSSCATTWGCWPRDTTRCACGSQATIPWPARISA